MFTTISKAFWCTTLLLAGTGMSVGQEKTAGEIMHAVQVLREDGTTSKSESTLVLIDSRGNQRVRKLAAFSKEYGDPENEDVKSVNFIVAPQDVKNTGYLSYDWGDSSREDDSWLFLPALKKIKRMASTDKSGSFMGSDFTFTDMRANTLEYWDYSFLKKSEMVDGQDCWVIKGVPKKGSEKKTIDETGYTGLTLWVRKDINMSVKGIFEVKKGKKTKYLSNSDIVQIQDIWVAKKSQMVLKKKERVLHSTVLIIDKMVYNEEIADDFFSPQTLENGL